VVVVGRNAIHSHVKSRFQGGVDPISHPSYATAYTRSFVRVGYF
jgi:hypothetical protein